MNDYVTKSELKEIIDEQSKSIDTKIDKAVTDLSEIIAGFAHQVDNRFNGLEKRVDEIDAKYSSLLNTIDGFLKRIDGYETEQSARDNQFAKLLEWARKVSKKTGIPLENL